MMNTFVKNSVSREREDKPQTRRKYLQKISLMIRLLSKIYKELIKLIKEDELIKNGQIFEQFNKNQIQMT